ncbi:hypothetical protein RhiirC2_727753 [Rhizophagus irregularis]|uniref:Uncharacterized protein n=1 Tax=Rhizophagus irregularis TaxID=588596 RepID=A0A2N1NZJ5_9GLOM|nr:hypothetical protein RhiirC2_727753 [Rhizophagus irregularis]
MGSHTFTPHVQIKNKPTVFVRLQPGARVMYLNNFLIEYGICNSTIGIITYINYEEQYVRVAFSVRGSIIEVNIYTPTILPSTETVPIGHPKLFRPNYSQNTKINLVKSLPRSRWKHLLSRTSLRRPQ